MRKYILISLILIGACNFSYSENRKVALVVSMQNDKKTLWFAYGGNGLTTGYEDEEKAIGYACGVWKKSELLFIKQISKYYIYALHRRLTGESDFDARKYLAKEGVVFESNDLVDQIEREIEIQEFQSAEKARQKQEQNSILSDYITNGNKAYDQEKFAEAKAFYQKGLSINPKNEMLISKIKDIDTFLKIEKESKMKTSSPNLGNNKPPVSQQDKQKDEFWDTPENTMTVQEQQLQNEQRKQEEQRQQEIAYEKAIAAEKARIKAQTNNTSQRTNIQNTDSKYSVTDIDGNVYKIVEIGKQIWMAENLKTTSYNDGSKIPNISSNSEWINLTSGAYCDYENNSNYGAQYGHLYNWFAINTGKLCPQGWHVPTYSDWCDLLNYLDANGYSNANAGTSIPKALAAKDGWESNNELRTIGNNSSTNNITGFTALPGGGRGVDGTFSGLRHTGYWWGSDSNAYYPKIAPALHIVSDYTIFRLEQEVPRTSGISIRCVKDSQAK